jgi:hypothetical protein
MTFKEININTYHGLIPSDSFLVIAERGNELLTAVILYDFDEAGIYDGDFTNPIYGFLKL